MNHLDSDHLFAQVDFQLPDWAKLSVCAFWTLQGEDLRLLLANRSTKTVNIWAQKLVCIIRLRYLPNKYMHMAVDSSFVCIDWELIVLPLMLSIKTMCASFVKTKATSFADSATVPLSEFFRLFSRVSGKVLIAKEMIGDVGLDTQSVVYKTDKEPVSSIVTCNRIIVIWI